MWLLGIVMVTCTPIPLYIPLIASLTYSRQVGVCSSKIVACSSKIEEDTSKRVLLCSSTSSTAGHAVAKNAHEVLQYLDFLKGNEPLQESQSLRDESDFL